MLVLTRKTQQQIKIGDNITVTIVRVTGQAVRVGIEAPEEIRVIRGELVGTPPKSVAPKTAEGDTSTSTSRVEKAASQASATPGPLAARCRNRLKSHLLSAPATSPTAAQSCVDDRRRVPGASFAPPIRRPQRLGPASLGGIIRMR
jgi:carbon storage regulator CsrA